MKAWTRLSTGRRVGEGHGKDLDRLALMHDGHSTFKVPLAKGPKKVYCKILKSYILCQHTVYYLFHEFSYHLFMWKERNMELRLGDK